MNKVRIYDLSRELNLDNKDILAICDRLRIPVKSHSSTITDESAERIRTVAEKYVGTHSSPSKSATVSHKPSSQSPATAPKPVAPKKQQILGIRQNQERPAVNSPKQSGANVAIPPQPPVSQPTSALMKPTTPQRPVRQNQNQEPVSIDIDIDKDTSPKDEKLQEVPLSRPAPEQPKLTEPPSRPVTTTTNRQTNETQPSQTQTSSAQIEQPVKKKPKTVATPQPPGEKKAQRREEKNEAVLGNKPSRPSASPALTLPVPELQRPKPLKPSAPSRTPRPSRPAIEDQDQREEGESEGAVESPTLADQDLKRPQPPRPPKKAKNWEESEEEEQPQKAKVKGSGKRTKQAIFDEDEVDLDESELEILPPTVQVSLSIARPPKPKASRSSQPITTAAATLASRGKKNAISRDRNSAKTTRRNREEAVAERPMKLILTGSMTVQELAESLGVPDTDIVKRLFFKGMAVNITQSLDVPTITMLATDLGVEVETAQKEAEASKGSEMIDAEDLEHLQRRPPVVTIMGHVDHGKTTLLDSIRQTKVAQGEAGGITQHIGAYHVDVEHNGATQQVVFLDTPGHQAFTAMRARGARVTDIAILVVAADDGVQPQTVEAISHAKAAEVPIIVAINKIDKPEAQPDRVKQELTEYGLVAEEWGGDTIMVPVSAIQKENLDTLLEMILLVAEVDENLSANPNRAAKGTVIEANLDKSRGPVATLLVQNGTLRVGDILVAGSAFGKVRAMIDDRGSRVEAATPSFAVEVLGLNEVPAAGDEFDVFQDEKKARAIAQSRSEQQRQSRLMRGRVTLTTLSAQAQEGELKELNLILKGDVQGSIEAIVGALQQLPQNQVQIRMLLSAPGEVTETDVDLAAASNAVIVGFNTTLASGARQAADQAGVDVREYNIIYKLLEDIQGAMEGLLEPELVEEALGEVEVRAVFPVGRGSIAGSYILSGKVIRNCKARVRRGSQVIYEGTLDSVKRMKEDVKEVNAGFECGIGIDKFNDWSVGDRIEAFKMVTKRRTLTPN
ncbi:translation initiation factor IF-2 [Argonema antarcticum]|uniref:translation initiation factor IF-2 n=1 Tax=Argonema antarcticum TaxID=2942763 RepID=UPI0020131C35|nr:translation initiation factor IF-2 [Argonema antarcticum]MCL1475320.1 translation initiation factor IF-2 [Argonema antarcticum A004/B2]